MSRLNRTWALTAVAIAVLGLSLSAVLVGAFGTAAAVASAPHATTATVPETASAAFGCRSSVLRATLAGTTLAEPAVANSATTPCNNASTLVQSAALLGNSPLNIGTVGPAGAYTYESGSLDGGTPGVTAIAEVNALSLNVGGYTLSVAGPIEAQAAVECVGTTLTPSYTSNLDALTVTGPGLPAAGETIELGSAVNQIVSGLPAALSALISIKANNLVQGTNSYTAQLLNVSLLTVGSTPTVNLVVGEASVSYADPNVCNANVTPGTTPGTVTTITAPTGTVPTAFEDCTPTSVLDSSTGDCVVYDNGVAIFVSKPFQGPQGGTVQTLSYARAHYHSSCLSGAGPGWVLIVTSVNGTAKGTPLSDRIIGLGSGEHIYGLAGDDCIDAQGAKATVSDGNGTDRIYVTKGVNRVVAGNGNNVIHGGSGKDWITDGTGNDYIYGGKGANRIDAYGNEKHIFGGPSNDRIWTNSMRAFISCGGGTKDILFARKGVAGYGKTHGCEKVALLK
jgi:Ca2+-binding RTX toxin-like protein